jgi:hypothetical protein
MDIQDLNHLAPFILAALVEEMGGIIELDAEEILEDIKSNKYTKLGIFIEKGRLYVEIFDEN